MNDTCGHSRRSRLATPIALLVGAVLLSSTSAYAAAQITGKQIKDDTVTSADVKNGSLTAVDVKNESVTGAKIKNGSVGRADLAPGLANKLESTRTRVGASVDLDGIDGWQWVLNSSDMPAHKVTEQRRFTVSGVVGYGSGSNVDVDVAVCSSVNGSDLAFVGGSYGTVRIPGGRVNVPVLGEVLASGVTLAIGPCIRKSSGANQLTADVSSITTTVTVP